jgi:hypothetical protein
MSKGSVRQAIMMLVAVFFGGIFVGVMLADYIEELPLPFTQSDRDYDDDVEDVIDAEQRLLRKLHLTTDQQRDIDQLLKQREDTLVAYWAERIPAMYQLIEVSRQNIRSKLNPEQRARYNTGLNELLQTRRRDD